MVYECTRCKIFFGGDKDTSTCPACGKKGLPFVQEPLDQFRERMIREQKEFLEKEALCQKVK